MAVPAKPGEFEIIARYFKPLAKPGWALGLADDAAVLPPEPGIDTVVTTDTIVQGVHFPQGEDPAFIAARLLGVNLSDLAAMGAEPRAYTLSLALPPDCSEDWLAAFADALGREQASAGIALVGGDTVATPGPLVLTLTAIGGVETGRALTRCGARACDRIYVSGTVGDGALGLVAVRGGLSELASEHLEFLADRFHRPKPRVTLGHRLVGIAHAAIDLSDGLVADLGHVAEASGVRAEVEAARVPLSDAARAAVAAEPGLLATALTGGDDYELLFTVPAEAGGAVSAIATDLALPLTEIGRIDKRRNGRPAITVLDKDGRPLSLPDGGYRHF